MKNPQSSRKKGAQAGNTNALKHGFYSAQFQPAERADLKAAAPTPRRSPRVAGLPKVPEGQGDGARTTGLQDEIDLIRVFLRRTIEAVNAEQNLTVEARLRALDVISKAAARLAHLTSVHHLVTVKIPSQEEALLTRQLINITRHSANVLLKAAHLEQLGPTQEEKDLQLGRELDEILQRCDPRPEEPPASTEPPLPPEQPGDEAPDRRPCALQSPEPTPLLPEPPGDAAPEQRTDAATRRRHRRHTPTRNLPTPAPIPPTIPPEEDPLPESNASPWLPEDAFETYLTTVS